MRKNSCTLPVPNCPGGRLMLWITSRETTSPSGRALKFGEGQCAMPWHQPLAGSSCMQAYRGERQEPHSKAGAGGKELGTPMEVRT
ncbi:hypothetical protein D3C80_2035560 [compost metagenome]